MTSEYLTKFQLQWVLVFIALYWVAISTTYITEIILVLLNESDLISSLREIPRENVRNNTLK